MSRKSVIVNALTFARAPLVVLWAVLAVVQEFGDSMALAFCAGAAMALSGLTDAWDGALARRWNVVSPLGKMADPLMDKIFYLIAFPVLVWQSASQGECAWHTLAILTLTVFYLLRDTWVTFMRSLGAMYGADVSAMMLGKVRTALSFPGAGWIYAYLSLHRFAPESWHSTWLASCMAVEAVLIVLTAISLFTYTSAYLPYFKRALERKADL